jgi:hypothetical protein
MVRRNVPIWTVQSTLEARKQAIRARRWKRVILVLVGMGLAFVLLALLAGL